LVSIFLSVAAIIVSITIALLSLWLNTLKGPDLSLIDDPKFELTDESFRHRTVLDYVPRRFELKPASFVFANTGKKAGAIVDIKLQITPHQLIKDYYKNFFVTFGTHENPDLPVVIGEGDIDIIQASVRLDFIDWKKSALVEVLDPKLKTKALVEKALIRSKGMFTNFCDFLESTQEIGCITCTVKMSKGNDLKEVTIGEYEIVNNFKTVSLLRGCLLNWKNIRPTKNELVREIEGTFREIMREIRANIQVAIMPVDENRINESKLRLDVWERLQKAYVSDRELRWFLIKRKDGLEETLTQLYGKIADYNSIIEEALFLGDLRTSRNIRKINDVRMKLLPELERGLTSL